MRTRFHGTNEFMRATPRDVDLFIRVAIRYVWTSRKPEEWPDMRRRKMGWRPRLHWRAFTIEHVSPFYSPFDSKQLVSNNSLTSSPDQSHIFATNIDFSMFLDEYIDSIAHVDVMAATSEDFQEALNEIFHIAYQAGKTFIDVISGELHRKVGGYPGRNHRMPLCCMVMRENMGPGDTILKEPPSGQGATLYIRYGLPR